MPALEPAHAVGWLAREAGRGAGRQHRAGHAVGPRDKDVAQIAERLTGERLDVTPRPTEGLGTLESVLRARATRGRKLLVPYVTGGLDDDWLDVVRAIDGRRRRGGDRDPVLRSRDGRSGDPGGVAPRALARGATPGSVITEASKLDDVPLAVMTYYNLAGHMGYRRLRALADAGIVGAILPDLPLDELTPWSDAADAARGGDGAPGGADHARRAPAGDLRAVTGLRVRGVAAGRHGRTSLASQAAEMGRRCKALTDVPVLLGVGISNADPSSGGGALGRRRRRGARARPPRCSRGAAPDGHTRSSASCAALDGTLARRRDQVPRLEAAAGAGARGPVRGIGRAHGARPVHRHDPGGPGVQAARRRRDRGRQRVATPRCSPRCYVETDAAAVDEDALDEALADLVPSPGARLLHRDVLRAVALLPAANGAASTPSATPSSATTPARARPAPAHQPDRGRRPGRLHHRRPDGVPEGVGAALLPPPQLAGRRCSGPGARCSATPRGSSARSAGSTSPTSTRPTTSTATSPTTTSGRRWSVGRARALRRRLQAGRRPGRAHQERVQPQAHMPDALRNVVAACVRTWSCCPTTTSRG